MAQEISTKGPVFSQLETHTKKKKSRKNCCKDSKTQFFCSFLQNLTTCCANIKIVKVKFRICMAKGGKGDLKAELEPAEVDPCFMTLTHFSSHAQVSWVHVLFVSEQWDKNYWVSFLWHLFCYMTHFEGMVSLVSQTPHQMIQLRQ